MTDAAAAELKSAGPVLLQHHGSLAAISVCLKPFLVLKEFAKYSEEKNKCTFIKRVIRLSQLLSSFWKQFLLAKVATNYKQ